jgi:N-acetylated-alpha-linked acidic dipeptidase
VFAATRDPWQPEAEPARKEVPPALDFAPLDSALHRLRAAAARYDSLAAARAAASAGSGSDAAALRDLNARLVATERALTRPEGLPGRPWYRHQIYAPGFYTGYGVKTLPGVREAIEQEQWEEARGQIGRLANVLDSASSEITSAADALARLRN